mmetsp:Transcript_26821/g.72342  ORF Transcript_26821/g.72342 Transcript_26821/m.72342 type:complete len:236 (-) Transcript_26821:559-1266(-)
MFPHAARTRLLRAPARGGAARHVGARGHLRGEQGGTPRCARARHGGAGHVAFVVLAPRLPARGGPPRARAAHGLSAARRAPRGRAAPRRPRAHAPGCRTLLGGCGRPVQWPGGRERARLPAPHRRARAARRRRPGLHCAPPRHDARGRLAARARHASLPRPKPRRCVGRGRCRTACAHLASSRPLGHHARCLPAHERVRGGSNPRAAPARARAIPRTRGCPPELPRGIHGRYCLL